MRQLRALVFGTLTALALAGMPGVSSAMVIATASPLHTGVHARVHLHHGHVRHVHRAHAELRAARAHSQAERSAPAPLMPRSRPARSHAALPHVAAKLHSSPSRGGAPYALGPASLSLALWTHGDPMPVHHNELTSNPSSGILRGRSPPRGDPLSATSSPHPARARNSRRAPLDPIHPIAITNWYPSTTRRHADPRPFISAGAGGIVASPLTDPNVTPDRAFEGRPAGSYVPSWRCFT